MTKNGFLFDKRGRFMKHEKEWHTCDRCGKEITRNGILNTTYELCYKCMEDFERFMRNKRG
jgi:hypothetical protein|nr:MAG TPA: cysteine-rich protein [Bacteriophage sp.]